MPNPLSAHSENITLQLKGGPYDGKRVKCSNLPTFLRVFGSHVIGWQTYQQIEPNSHIYQWVRDNGTSWLFTIE